MGVASAAGGTAGTHLAAGARDVSAGSWGTAKEVPGTATLNKGGNAQINSISCASAGNCSAGGVYTESSGDQEALVVSQANGTWGTAKVVPGSAALNAGGAATIFSVSCASAGNCSAGGAYTDASGHVQAPAASKTNGTWSTATELPGTAALNQGTLAQVNSISCGSAGNCSAVGFYSDSSGRGQAFVANQTNGVWGTAVEFPGTASPEASGAGANAQSVSCASAGHCSAGGSYSDSSGAQVFVATETNGTWSPAKEVPGTVTLNKGGNAQINSISCASAANCSAGGSYTNAAVHAQAFLVNRT
jgi:hypothetical protein